MNRLTGLAAAFSLLAASTAFAQTPASGPERFLPEIQAFAAQDAAAPPAPCSILFVGSSSIRFWTSLKADMAPIAVINRGFGGSQIADVNAYFDRVVTPYRPRAIVFYAGENDLNAGRSPDEVVESFERFLSLKEQALGDAPVYFISVKPSKARLAQKGAQDQVNARVEALARVRSDLDYIDVVTTMLTPDGQPKDIFVADDLHMTPAGYALWTAKVAPVMQTVRACPKG